MFISTCLGGTGFLERISANTYTIMNGTWKCSIDSKVLAFEAKSKQRQSSNSLMSSKSIFNSQLELIIIRQKEHFSQKKSSYKLELCILALFHWTFVIDGFHGILSKKRSSTRRQGLLLNSLIMIGHPCNSLECRHLGQFDDLMYWDTKLELA